MSNFNCSFCGILNIDSGKQGFTQGCIHYPPEHTAIYECIVKRKGLHDLNQRILYNHFKRKWTISDFEQIKSWKVNSTL